MCTCIATRVRSLYHAAPRTKPSIVPYRRSQRRELLLELLELLKLLELVLVLVLELVLVLVLLLLLLPQKLLLLLTAAASAASCGRCPISRSEVASAVRRAACGLRWSARGRLRSGGHARWGQKGEQEVGGGVRGGS